MTTPRRYSPQELAEILKLHARWWHGEEGGQRADLTGAVLTHANLTGANLRDAFLRDADLTDANLTRADLTGAVLTHADLTGANLRDAFLRDADLRDANLRDANLRDANLTDANLTGAVMPAGYRWEAYLAQVVPALLQGGGTPLGDVLAALRANGGWSACHRWSDCPLHVAYGVEGFDGLPPQWRWEAQQFVRLFDQGLIPEPAVPEEGA